MATTRTCPVCTAALNTTGAVHCPRHRFCGWITCSCGALIELVSGRVIANREHAT